MTRKTVGLALSGGAARGFAHLGVLKVLEEHSVPIDFIAGTSAGSIAGGGAASGLNAAEIIEIARQTTWMGMAGFSYSPKGFLTNAQMGNFLKAHFPYRNIEELPIPFAAVACDLETGQEVVIDRGDLPFAIRASCAIPGVFMPLEDAKGRKLIDGGVVAPIPTRALREMGPDVIIAVDVLACGSSSWGSPSTLLGVFFQSAMMLLRAASKAQHYQADIVITPEIAHLRPDELGKLDEFLKGGEEAALGKIEEIKALIESVEDAAVTLI